MEYTDLTDDDYRNILKYYEEPVPKSMRLMRKNAETIMAAKLCGCIKKVGVSEEGGEARAIGICSRSIFGRKSIRRGAFKCRKRGRTVAMQKRAKGQSTKGGGGRRRRTMRRRMRSPYVRK